MTARGPQVDVAVDPLEGTRLTALGQPNAIAVIAVAERGSMFFPGAAVYMEKIAAGADAVDAIDINATPTENVNAVAKAKGVRPTDVRVVVLERERHERADRRAPSGGRARQPDSRRRRRPRDRRRAARDRRRPALRHRRHAGGRHLRGCAEDRRRRDPGEALAAQRRGTADGCSPPVTTSTACYAPTISSRGDDVFVAATGVTTGALLRGVRYVRGGAITDSIALRSRSGTVRRIEARHQLSKLEKFTGREY